MKQEGVGKPTKSRKLFTEFQEVAILYVWETQLNQRARKLIS